MSVNPYNGANIPSSGNSIYPPENTASQENRIPSPVNGGAVQLPSLENRVSSPLLEGASEESLSNTIQTAQNAGLLPQQTQPAAETVAYHPDTIRALQELEAAGISNEANRNAVLVGNRIDRAFSTEAFFISRALIEFHHAGILTAENRNAILLQNGQHAYDIGNQLLELHDEGILTEENRNAILTGVGLGRDYNPVFEEMMVLHREGLLTPLIVNAMAADPMNAEDISDEIIEHLYSGLGG